jgi:hypothetical protein
MHLTLPNYLARLREHKQNLQCFDRNRLPAEDIGNSRAGDAILKMIVR